MISHLQASYFELPLAFFCGRGTSRSDEITIATKTVPERDFVTFVNKDIT